jgi:hypothetical protein
VIDDFYRFLQSPSSTIVLNEHEARIEHGAAAITCLISGLQVFSTSFDRQKRLLRLIRGIHGFHVYATEYWSEYLLSNTFDSDGLIASSTLLVKASLFADRLDEAALATHSIASTFGNAAIDERLMLFREYQKLYKYLEAALNSRSQKCLEQQLAQTPGKPVDPNFCSGSLTTYLAQDFHQTQSYALDGISKMLQSYQQAVEMVLQKDFYPGASADELEQFKNHFRTSAYTCRLRFCPRATIGFDNKQLRYEHEVTHATFRCIQPDCQYPPFQSVQTLKAHVNKFHDLLPPRKPIRRPGTDSLRTQQSGFRLPTGAKTREDIRNVMAWPSFAHQDLPLHPSTGHLTNPIITPTKASVDWDSDAFAAPQYPLTSIDRRYLHNAFPDSQHRPAFVDIASLLNYEDENATEQVDRCEYALRRESAD